MKNVTIKQKEYRPMYVNDLDNNTNEAFAIHYDSCNTALFVPRRMTGLIGYSCIIISAAGFITHDKMFQKEFATLKEIKNCYGSQRIVPVEITI